MAEINQTTDYAVEDGVAVITVNNPPVNALGALVRQGLAAAVSQAVADPAAHAIVITCAGRTFFAGADITEFGKPLQKPDLNEVIAGFDASAKPIIAGIFGTALGGGLELAMGCHYRVAVPSARLGLPEVKLGLLPGAGGTQRLPRLIGPEAALKIITSGTPMSAPDARAAGLIDELVEDARAGAIALAKRVAGQAFTRVRDRDDKLAPVRADTKGFDAAAKGILQKAPGQDAPAACVTSVRNAFTLAFDEGLAAERAMFLGLVTGAQSQAQRHVFFAEREAAKLPGLPEQKLPAPAQAAVIGGGTMGGGIAMCFANAGVPVMLLEMNADTLAKGLEKIRGTYQISVNRGSLDAATLETRMALISGTANWQDLATADIIIEAVYENLEVKKEVFTKLDAIAKPGALLATNTSTLDIDAIAAATARPASVLGMHFFSPANVMKLLEIVRGAPSAPGAIARAVAVGKLLGKIPVVVGNCDGFVGNRMLARRTAACEQLLLEGAAPEAVDAATRRFGFPMGPYEMGDLAGLDVGWRIRQHRGITAPVTDVLCARGRFGQKTGAGYYLYLNGSRTPVPDPEVTLLASETAATLGIAPRGLSEQDILERTIYPMINEAARILEEGIATRPSDIDVIWVYGYGWPAWRGGPCFYADQIGAKTIVAALERQAAASGDERDGPAPLLRELAASGGSFANFKLRSAA